MKFHQILMMLFIAVFISSPALAADEKLTSEDSTASKTSTIDITKIQEAAEKGDAKAEASLGDAYYFGKGVPKNYYESVKWLRKAADQGVGAAERNLGFAYYNGEGAPRDKVLSYMWFDLAAAHGDKEASQNRDMIEQSMTAEQLASAQRMASDWLQQHPKAK